MRSLSQDKCHRKWTHDKGSLTLPQNGATLMLLHDEDAGVGGGKAARVRNIMYSQEDGGDTAGEGERR